MDYSILWIIAIAVAGTESQTCLTTSNEVVDDCQQDEIYQAIYSDIRFWFGTCSKPGPNRLACSQNPSPAGTNLVKRLLNGDYNIRKDQLKYLSVKYVSKPGNYTACDHLTPKVDTKVEHLDPSQKTVDIEPWYARNLPEIRWKAAGNEMYTLLVVDAGYFTVHGLYINIPGSDMAQAEVAKQYFGPQRPRFVPNPYAFLLFKQSGRVVLKEQYKDTLYSAKNNFNISSFRNDHGLTGPFGWNWLMSSRDLYTVEISRIHGTQYCARYVQDALRYLGKPFIPEHPILNVYIHMEFDMPDVHFDLCCKHYDISPKTVILDPIGNGKVTAAETFTDNIRRVELRAQGQNVNNTAALLGKRYTILAVDADIPNKAVGNSSHPLVHWLRINMRDGDLNTGDEVVSYRGPAPPDDKPHHYFFLLYEHDEQDGEMSKTAYQDYAGANCTDRLKYICLFDVKRFVLNQHLSLVGATWMQAENDVFVNHLRKQRGTKEAELCEGVPEYRDPCSQASKPQWNFAVFVAIFLSICAM